ncbi:MAG: DUF1738 domain-containing protein [Candidatus Aminicenantes bacterium]|nr:DUF1738 domain-containing protein [Candidatus Aminicenantes bacterium]
MKNQKVNFKELLGFNIRVDIDSYYYKRVFGHFDLKERINDFFIGKLEQKIVPWHAVWCQPWPMDYRTKKEFRGVNFFLLRSNTTGFCPYWLPRSYLKDKEIQPKEGEKGTPVIIKKDRVPQIETFYNIKQLQNFDMPEIKKPKRYPPEITADKVFEYFKDIKKYDDFDFKIEDFKGQDPDHFYYLLFQYFVFNRYCREYKKETPFKPDIYDKETLIFKIGAAFLAAYCRISTPYYSMSGLELNKWKMLLMEDKNAIFEAAAIALKMYDSFVSTIELKQAS